MELLPPNALPPFLLGTFGLRPFRVGHGGVGRQMLAVSADGATLWFFEGYKLVTLSAEDGLTRNAIVPNHSASFHGVARTADDGVLLIGYYDVLWYDPRNDVARGALKLERGARWGVATSPADPDRAACIVLYGTPGAQLLSRTDGGTTLPLALDERAGKARQVAFTPDGAAVLVLCARAVLRFDANTGDALPPLVHLDAPHGPGLPALDDLFSLAFADDRSAVVVDCRGKAAVLDLTTGEARASGELQGTSIAGPSANGLLVVAREGAVDLHELPSLARVASLPGDFAPGPDGGVVLDPSRPVAWAVDHRGALHRVDLAARSLHTTVPANAPHTLAWSGDSFRVARFDTPTETVDLATGASTFSAPEPAAHTRPPWLRKDVRVVATSPAGRLTLAVGNSACTLHDARDGAELARYKLPGVAFAHFITEEEALVGGPRGVRWIDVRTGAVLSHAKRVTGERGAVSPDGRVAAAVMPIESVILVTREQPDEPVWFACAMHPMCVAFSPDSARVAVAGMESVVRVFDVAAALATRAPPKKKRK
ncbi:MAG: hypothetical protein U0324_30055 [Polyangiales bacterium]